VRTRRQLRCILGAPKRLHVPDNDVQLDGADGVQVVYTEFSLIRLN
jgi:hypothetical protein